MPRYVYKKASTRTIMGLYDWFGRTFKPRHAPQPSGRPRKICCVMLHQIGDVIMSLPTVEALHAMAPEASLSLIIGSVPAKLFPTPPYNADIRIFDPVWQKVVRQFAVGEAKSAFLKLLDELSPDVVIVFHPDLVVNQLLGQTTIPHTFSFTNAGGGFHVSHPIDMPESGHQVERTFALAKAFATTFGCKLPPLAPPSLMVDPSAKKKVAQELKSRKLSPDKLVVLHPFASAETKNWPKESWQALITALQQKQWQVVIIGGPNDDFDDASLPSFCGQLSLPETVALLAQARLFIGIDSGPGHMAAAVRCPIVTVFSSVNDPERWKAYGDPAKTIILHHPVSNRQLFPYEMRDLPAGTNGNPYSDGITPAEVIKAAEKLLSL